MAVFKYYLGLDMGTNSVGWAVTDIQYNILKVKGKDLWGIRV
jgi:CRISPR-associated endonuclease Csn1